MERGEARKVGEKFPTISEEEETGGDLGIAISINFGNDGGQCNLSEQTETNAEEKALWNVELGGAKISP